MGPMNDKQTINPEATSRWHTFMSMFTHTRLSEFLSGLIILGWGLFLLFPEDNATTSGVTRSMANILPAAVWGVSLCALAAAQMVGAALALKKVRIAAAFIAAPFWGFLTLAISISGTRVVSLVAYAAFAGICSWTYLRLANEGLQSVLQRRMATWVRHRLRGLIPWSKKGRG